MDTDRKFKVLAIAEAANPDWTSVPLVGWSFVHALRDVADVHLVTQVRNREAIQARGYREGIDFTTIDTEAVARPLWKISTRLRGGEGKGWTTALAIATLGYYYFEHLVWRFFARDVWGGKYDVVHRITPLSPTTPSLLAGKCRRVGTPFVLGPLNGGVPWPKAFDAARRQEKEWLSYVRGAYRLLPGYRSTLRNATGILVGSRYTLSQIPGKYHDKCQYLPENGIDPERFSLQCRNREPGSRLRLSFVGRLVPYKGPDMLLESVLPLAKEGKIHLDLIGDGPLMPRLQEMIAQHDLAGSVTIHGWINHEELQAILGQSEVLAFPSIREFGGGVVLEAMALGVVPVVVDYGGPGELVDSSVGFKVPIGDRNAIINNFRNRLGYLAKNRHVLQGLSAAAVQRVKDEFLWSKKAVKITEFYRKIL